MGSTAEMNLLIGSECTHWNSIAASQEVVNGSSIGVEFVFSPFDYSRSAWCCLEISCSLASLIACLLLNCHLRCSFDLCCVLLDSQWLIARAQGSAIVVVKGVATLRLAVSAKVDYFAWLSCQFQCFYPSCGLARREVLFGNSTNHHPYSLHSLSMSLLLLHFLYWTLFAQSLTAVQCFSYAAIESWRCPYLWCWNAFQFLRVLRTAMSSSMSTFHF